MPSDTTSCTIFLPEASKQDLREQGIFLAAGVLRSHGWYVASLYLRRMDPAPLRVVSGAGATRDVRARLADAGVPARSMRRGQLRYAASLLRDGFPDEADYLERVALDDRPSSYVRTGNVLQGAGSAHPGPPVATRLSQLYVSATPLAPRVPDSLPDFEGPDGSVVVSVSDTAIDLPRVCLDEDEGDDEMTVVWSTDGLTRGVTR